MRGNNDQEKITCCLFETLMGHLFLPLLLPSPKGNNSICCLLKIAMRFAVYWMLSTEDNNAICYLQKIAIRFGDY